MTAWRSDSRHATPHRSARLLGLGRSDYVEDWRDSAACLGIDPELFFPVGDGPIARAQVADAKTVCAHCPVIERCRAYALRTGMTGVWGGLDDHERRRLRAG